MSNLACTDLLMNPDCMSETSPAEPHRVGLLVNVFSYCQLPLSFVVYVYINVNVIDIMVLMFIFETSSWLCQ